MPSFQRATLSNGLRVVLLEDHEVPLVRGFLRMRGGTNASPADQVGLASMAVAVQRSGGSTALPAPQLDALMDQLAAGIEGGTSAQALSLDFFCNTEDLPRVLNVWAGLLQAPALPADRLALVQDQVVNAIEHQDDDPTRVGRRELQKLMYGATSIHARQPEKAGVLSVTVADLKAYLDTWERPDGAVLGVVGDFTPDQLLPLLERELNDWRPAPGQPEQPPQFVREADVLGPAREHAGGVYVIDRPGLVQSSVFVSEPGVGLLDPDAYALDVLATTFNSFGGALFDQLRSRDGLAYSVFGTWDTPPDHTGVFLAGGQTSAPGDFILGLRRVLREATERPPSEDAFEAARSETLNAFVFNFASRAAQLQRVLTYDLLGLPPDLLFRFRDAIVALGPSDVLEAAQRHLHPELQVTVVVGDAARVMPQLKAAGLLPVIPLQLPTR